jgi:hypothetical protein
MSHTINTRKLRTQLRNLTIHPEKHDQGTWAKVIVDENQIDVKPRPSACGSFGCLAGNTVLAEGHGLYWEGSFLTDQDGTSKAVWSADYIDEDGERGAYIATAAREILGLDYEQASALFSGANSQADLWNLAIVFTEGDISLYDYLDARDESIRVAKEAADEAEAKALLTKFRATYPAVFKAVDEAQAKEDAKNEAARKAALQRYSEHTARLLGSFHGPSAF